MILRNGSMQSTEAFYICKAFSYQMSNKHSLKKIVFPRSL